MKPCIIAVVNSFRLSRGIDAPESSMPYGKEAKDELVKIVQGKCLRVLVYGEDRYGRSVGDIYCNGIFVQVLHSSAMILTALLMRNEYTNNPYLSGIDAQKGVCMALHSL